MENNKNMRELYKIYRDVGHEVFEETCKKAIELYFLHMNHDSSNVIGMHSLNVETINNDCNRHDPISENEVLYKHVNFCGEHV